MVHGKQGEPHAGFGLVSWLKKLVGKEPAANGLSSPEPDAGHNRLDNGQARKSDGPANPCRVEALDVPCYGPPAQGWTAGTLGVSGAHRVPVASGHQPILPRIVTPLSSSAEPSRFLGDCTGREDDSTRKVRQTGDQSAIEAASLDHRRMQRSPLVAIANHVSHRTTPSDASTHIREDSDYDLGDGSDSDADGRRLDALMLGADSDSPGRSPSRSPLPSAFGSQQRRFRPQTLQSADGIPRIPAAPRSPAAGAQPRSFRRTEESPPPPLLRMSFGAVGGTGDEGGAPRLAPQSRSRLCCAAGLVPGRSPAQELEQGQGRQQPRAGGKEAAQPRPEQRERQSRVRRSIEESTTRRRKETREETWAAPGRSGGPTECLRTTERRHETSRNAVHTTTDGDAREGLETAAARTAASLDPAQTTQVKTFKHTVVQTQFTSWRTRTTGNAQKLPHVGDASQQPQPAQRPPPAERAWEASGPPQLRPSAPSQQPPPPQSTNSRTRFSFPNLPNPPNFPNPGVVSAAGPAGGPALFRVQSDRHRGMTPGLAPEAAAPLHRGATSPLVELDLTALDEPAQEQQQQRPGNTADRQTRSRLMRRFLEDAAGGAPGGDQEAAATLAEPPPLSPGGASADAVSEPAESVAALAAEAPDCAEAAAAHRQRHRRRQQEPGGACPGQPQYRREETVEETEEKVQRFSTVSRGALRPTTPPSPGQPYQQGDNPDQAKGSGAQQSSSFHSHTVTRTTVTQTTTQRQDAPPPIGLPDLSPRGGAGGAGGTNAATVTRERRETEEVERTERRDEQCRPGPEGGERTEVHRQTRRRVVRITSAVKEVGGGGGDAGGGGGGRFGTLSPLCGTGASGGAEFVSDVEEACGDVASAGGGAVSVARSVASAASKRSYARFGSRTHTHDGGGGLFDDSTYDLYDNSSRALAAQATLMRASRRRERDRDYAATLAAVAPAALNPLRWHASGRLDSWDGGGGSLLLDDTSGPLSYVDRTERRTSRRFQSNPGNGDILVITPNEQYGWEEEASMHGEPEWDCSGSGGGGKRRLSAEPAILIVTPPPPSASRSGCCDPNLSGPDLLPVRGGISVGGPKGGRSIGGGVGGRSGGGGITGRANLELSAELAGLSAALAGGVHGSGRGRDRR